MATWIRSGVISNAPTLIDELGGDLAAIAEAAGLSCGVFDNPETPITVAGLCCFLEQATRALGADAFCLWLGGRQDFSLFGSIAELFDAATTIGELADDLVAYFPLLSQGATIGSSREPGGIAINFELAGEIHDTHRFAVEWGFSLLVAEVRRHVPGWQSEALWLRHAPPAQRDAYRRLLSSNLHFNADRNAVFVSDEILRHPTRCGDRSLHNRLAVDYRLAARDPQLVAAHVERIVRATLPFYPIGAREAARLVGLSHRTLQRRLEQIGTSFEAIRDIVRADLSLSYLRESTLTVAEIAEILQFSETSVLTRAVRRWHGDAPSAIRRHHPARPAPFFARAQA